MEDSASIASFQVNYVNNTSLTLSTWQSFSVANEEDIRLIKEHITQMKESTINLRGLYFHHLSGHISLSLVFIVIIILIAFFTMQVLISGRLEIMFLCKFKLSLFGPWQNVQI